MPYLCLREYGFILKGERADKSLLVCGISHPQAWAFLEQLAWSHDDRHAFIRTATYNGQKALQVTSFIGVITTPDGTQIEILPKTSEEGQDTSQTRKLLWRMLQAVDLLPFIETTDADLALDRQPLIEVLITRFLQHLTQVVRRGIRKDYTRIAAEEYFLKGHLQLERQLRQPISKQPFFCIEYDVFSDNRAENRLIHAALERIAKSSRSDANQRLCRELRFAFDEVPVSFHVKADFSQWRSSRDMIYYQSLLPWLRLILNQQCPFTLLDEHTGISFLFPMEVLFEKYVARILAQHLPAGYSLKTQVADRFISINPKAFMLKPDIVVYKNDQPKLVLDTKWKLIDADTRYNNGSNDLKAGINQADMYQMFSYGKKYFTNAPGRLGLIYPAWRKFSKSLPSFEMDTDLYLDTVPFPLDIDSAVDINALLAQRAD